MFQKSVKGIPFMVLQGSLKGVSRKVKECLAKSFEGVSRIKDSSRKLQ